MRTLAPYPLPPPPPPLEPPPLRPASRIILAPLQPLLLLLRLEPPLPRGTDPFVFGLSFIPPPFLHPAASRSIVLARTLTQAPIIKGAIDSRVFTPFGESIRTITKNPGRQGTHGTVAVGLPSSSQTPHLPPPTLQFTCEWITSLCILSSIDTLYLSIPFPIIPAISRFLPEAIISISFSCPPESLVQQRELPQSLPSPLVTVRRPRISPLVRPSLVPASVRPVLALISLWISQHNRNLLRRPGDKSDSDSVLLPRQLPLPLPLPLPHVVVIETARQCHNQGKR